MAKNSLNCLSKDRGFLFNCYYYPYFGKWSSHYYQKKKELIHELIKIFEETGWIFGKQRSDNYHTKYIVYFLIPECEQISFHCNLDVEVPDFPFDRDGKSNSTLSKVERALTLYFAARQGLFH